MFVVGKKYIHRDDKTNVCECIATSGNKGWLLDGGDPTTFNYTPYWKEYHEPVVVKERRWVEVDGKQIYLPSSRPHYPLGEIEITVTDGKLTDVRIVS